MTETMIDPYSLAEGQSLGQEQYGPLNQSDLDAYGSASGDTNPIHLDPEYAKNRGLDGTIAHGMYIMALLSRYWSARVSPLYAKRFDTRFTAMTGPGDRLTVEGRVRRIRHSESGGRELTLDLRARGQDGTLRATGTLQVSLPGRDET